MAHLASPRQVQLRIAGEDHDALAIAVVELDRPKMRPVAPASRWLVLGAVVVLASPVPVFLHRDVRAG